MRSQEKLSELRKRMTHKELDAWIVPSTDPHQSEYVASHWQTRAWLSGFTGSAGTLVITQNRAGLWTDPRYHLRAAMELEGSGIELFRAGLPGTPLPGEWLCQELSEGGWVGFDGSVFSVAEAEELRLHLAKKGIGIVHQFDLAGDLWEDRPPLPKGTVFLLPDAFSGESRLEKLSRIRTRMAECGVAYHLLCSLDEIAWTFNLRGNDIPHNPVAICYGMIGREEAHIFIDAEKISAKDKDELKRDGVNIQDYDAIFHTLRSLPKGSRVQVDPDKTNVRLFEAIPAGCEIRQSPSIPHMMKAVKNRTELEGIRRMHLRDGAAVVRWLCWLDQSVKTGRETEVTVAMKLDEFRSEGEYYWGSSFATIAGYGKNSAIGHYQTDPNNPPVVLPEGILLVDSGAQYLDGTSDITRTLSLGVAGEDEKRAFTQVLQCHIRLASAKYPYGTKGMQLDAIAREPLWRKGWNCRHGIGHGVGCFLNVHEGPQRLNEENTIILEPGMVLSNEPGVYFAGQFGIRIENILVTVLAEATEFGQFLAFETVSLCPMDLDLVELALLEPAEVDWLNAYHRMVSQQLSPHLSEDERNWLAYATRAV